MKNKNNDKEIFYIAIMLFLVLCVIILFDMPSIIKIEDISLIKKIKGDLLLLGVIGIIKIIIDFTFWFKVNYLALRNILDKSIISTYDDKARFMWLLLDIPLIVIIINHNSWTENLVGYRISTVIAVILFILIRKIIATLKAKKDK